MDDTFEDCIRAARAALTQARHLIQTEISGYPGPISGCDAQFNYLLEERQKVLAAIHSLDAFVFVPTPRTPMQASGVESR